jgi:hypothetical protein
VLSAIIADWFMVRWVYPAPSPPGAPARRAMLPGMLIPRLAREAGLARGCGKRAHRELSSNCQ